MKVFDYFNYVFLAMFALIAIFPLWYVFAGSLSDGQDYMNGGVWFLPRVWTLSNFKVILSDKMLWYAFRNTILKTLIGSVTSLVFTCIVAYAMSRQKLKGRNIFRIIMLFTMFFSGGLIPTFVWLNKLGFYNSFLIYIVPSMFSVYNMIIISSFFRTVSEELHEAAIVEGANEFRIFWTIYMPLSKPILATITLWTAVAHWNSYFNTMIYSDGQKEMITLQYYLMGVINQANYSSSGIDPSVLEQVTSKTVSFAAIVIATIPILFVYPFLQRYFTTGAQAGATKG